MAFAVLLPVETIVEARIPVVRVGREHFTWVALTLNPSPNSGRRGWGMRAIDKTEIHPVEKPAYGFTTHLESL
jgi:hypothetical protein